MKKLLCILLFPIQAFATNYYVSNSGSDAAAGTIAAPWASIAKVNSSMGSFVAGDSVLFQREGTFTGTLTISKGIVFGAYGSGNLPILTGFYTIPSWTAAGTNLWTATIPSGLNNVRLLTINGQITRVGRYPNYADNTSGWIRYTNTLTAVSPINVSAGSSIPTSFVGGELVLFKNNWNLDVMPITGQSGNTFTCTNPAGMYGITANGFGDGNWGFFVQNNLATLDLQNEWHYNNSTKVVTIYSTSSPTGTIKIPRQTNIVNLGSTSNVTLENLDIQGCTEKAVTGSGSNQTIKNCIIRFAQGWGIDMRGSSAVISGNLVRDIGSNGIWVTNSAIIQENQVKAVGIIEGLAGLTNSGAGTQGNQDNQHQGIEIETGSSAVVYCGLNNIDSTGYAGIRYYGSNITIEKNVITYPCIMKSDGGGIYSWDQDGGVTFTNRRVKNNVILNSGKTLFGTSYPGLSTQGYGIYCDAGTSNVLIDSNIIGPSLSGSTPTCSKPPYTEDDGGIYLNGGKNLTVRGNIIFGWPHAIEYWRYQNVAALTNVTGMRIVGNAMYVTNGGTDLCTWRHSFRFYNYGAANVTDIINAIKNMGVIDSNFVATTPSPFMYKGQGGNPGAPISLETWRTNTGKDLNTTVMPSTTPEFQYNATATPTTYTFTGRQKRDFRGNTYNNSATIPAYYGNIFFDNGSAGSNPPTVSCSATAISCNGGSSTVTVSGSGGTPPLTGTGTFSRTAGTYTFTVTDAAGQTGSCNVTITQPTALVASNTAGTITTVGGSANIVVTASGGIAPYSGTGTFSRTAGTYTFTVTDANGCTATTTRTLTNPSPVVVTCSSTPILCNGGTSTITVSASGGTGPYNNTGSFIRSAGTYTFSVTDAVGATGSCSLTVTQPSELVASATAGTISTVGGTTSVVVTATGGTGAYTGTGTFTRGAGIHTFTVTDANGCSSFVIVSLNDPVIVAPQTLRINNIRFVNGN